MYALKTAVVAILLVFSMSAFAGYQQPAPVTVDIDPNDGSFTASGDMLSARTAKNDVESIGCGVRKFADHLPLYRLSEIFSRDEVQISRQYLSQIVLKSGEALRPLYDEMLKRLKNDGRI